MSSSCTGCPRCQRGVPAVATGRVSPREIAQRTGQCQSEVSNIVQGRQVRDVTVLERVADGLGVPQELMRLAGRGTAPEVLSAAAWAEPLLRVPGSRADPVRAEGGGGRAAHGGRVAGFDYWRHNRAMHHFRKALDLATEVGDASWQAEALIQAGLVIREFGHPDDGLKLLQLGLVKAWDIPDDEPRAVVVGSLGKAAVEAGVREETATALADLGRLDAAEVEMATARELWSATRADTYGDLDHPAALLALRRGQLDVAELLAAAAVRRWEGINQRGHAMSSIVLATVPVRAGELGGLPLAHNAITAVSKLSSVRVRKRLQPLAAALSARPGRDAQHLARLATAISSHRSG